MKILVAMPKGDVFSTFFPQYILDELNEMGEVTFNETGRNFTREELADALTGVDVCITGWGAVKFTEEVLKKADKLRLIAHTGGTVQPLYTDALYDRGIHVMSGNECYAESVGEGVIAYILAAQRRLVRFANEMNDQGWHGGDSYNEGLFDKSIGLIGFGATARHTARLLKVFRPKLYINADHVSAEEAAQYGAQKATKEQIFSECDIVSLHTAATPQTYHEINEELLNRMKDGALLVNTARGSVIDEAALAKVLAKGNIRAVLDVYEKEPLPMNSPLRGLQNALLIPHMAGPTVDRRAHITHRLLTEIPNVLAGKTSELTITRERAQWMTQE